ncbi:MAG: hypothetical protein Q8O35_11640, partial [Humidesulfovibrio sp.]|uniref:hypothetical protein n=1 Tax=Humidesulfovibrio sp. TaxID=2910988 RepID=UPI002732A4FD
VNRVLSSTLFFNLFKKPSLPGQTPSGCLKRRGAFLGEPLPRVNTFLAKDHALYTKPCNNSMLVFAIIRRAQQP